MKTILTLFGIRKSWKEIARQIHEIDKMRGVTDELDYREVEYYNWDKVYLIIFLIVITIILLKCN